MKMLKRLPVDEWPQADREAFRAAYQPGDVFDETAGPGAHLSEATREMIRSTYRRWLGFLKSSHPDDFSMSPTERIAPERVRAFINHLSAEVSPSSVAIAGAQFYSAAQLIAPTTDWAWLRSIKLRLTCRARRADRFDRLVPPLETLNFGIELMDAALRLPISGRKEREIQYRDGLLLALLSLWPIRRRSIAALTISRHIEFDDAGMNILLHPSDTKVGRAESFRVPEQFVSYVMRYLREIRPALGNAHDGFWASIGGRALTGDRLYAIVRARITAKFGKAMGLHDFRRAASTFLAMDAPEKIGLIPGVLQHASPEVSDRHYNLARSIKAGQRFALHLADARNRLRSFSSRTQE